MLGSLLCQLGAVGCSWDSPWRVQMVCDHGCCGWCGAGLPFVLADCIHRFGAVGDLFPGMLDGKVVHSNLSHLIGGCLEWLGHKVSRGAFPRGSMHRRYGNIVHACDAHHWSSRSGPSRSWCMWWDLGGPLLAWPQSLPILQGAHGYWHCVSFLVGCSRGRQKLSPWSLSVPLCCQLASIVHASLGMWCLGLQKHTWGGPRCQVECSWGGASSPRYGQIWRRSGMHLESSSHSRQAYWCCPSCQHTGNSICCGLGRLGYK